MCIRDRYKTICFARGTNREYIQTNKQCIINPICLPHNSVDTNKSDCLINFGTRHSLGLRGNKVDKKYGNDFDSIKNYRNRTHIYLKCNFNIQGITFTANFENCYLAK